MDTVRTKKKVGRPSKLNEDVKARLTEALRKGAYKEDACAYAGINKSTLYHWLELGELRGKGEYKEFLDAVEAASAEGILSNLGTIKIASDKGDWRAAAWWLEHKEPVKYGSRERKDINLKVEDDTDVIDARVNEYFEERKRRGLVLRDDTEEPIYTDNADTETGSASKE